MTVPECLQCGTCCFSRLSDYVAVSGSDHTRLGDRAEELVNFDGYHAYMRMVDGHCAALLIDPVTDSFTCDVYAQRPDTCRNLARSSGACKGELHAKGDRPLIALGRARLLH